MRRRTVIGISLGIALVCLGLGSLFIFIASHTTDTSACGSGYELVETVDFADGEITLHRQGDDWCAVTNRTGRYEGTTGMTRVVLSDLYGAPNHIIEDGPLPDRAGPVYLPDTPCVYAFGVVGGPSEYQDDAGITHEHCAPRGL